MIQDRSDFDSIVSGRTHLSVVLFDGVCNLCNGSVQFILSRNSKGSLRFASLQSEFGKRLLRHYGIQAADSLHSMVLIEKGELHTRSSAVLKISRHLGGLWPVCSLFLAIPAFLRNWAYDRLAESRYRLFGKRETCLLPEAPFLERFLDAGETPEREGRDRESTAV